MKRLDQFEKKPVPRRYIAVAEEILKAISEGKFNVGSKLPGERELSELYDVSRTTAREALLALELIGAVQVHHGKGAFIVHDGKNYWKSDVSGFLASHPFDLIQTRSILESGIAELIANEERKDLSNLTQNIEQTKKVFQDDAKLDEYLSHSFNFHRILISYSPNKVVQSIAEQLMDIDSHPFWRIINRLASMDPEVRKKHATEHEKIYNYLKVGEAKQAKIAVNEHLIGIMNDMQNQLKELDNS